MLMIIVGTLIGAIWGAVVGSYAWIGAFLGGLTAGLISTIQRSNALAQQVKQLSVDLSNTQKILAKLEQQQLKNRDVGSQIADSETNHLDQTIPDQSRNTVSTDDQAGNLRVQTVSPSTESELPDLPEEVLSHAGKADPWLAESTPSAPRMVKLPAESLAPIEPTIAEKLVNKIKSFFTEGNPIVRVGMVVMFFGVSFLVKYASTQGLFPIEFRLTGVLAIALALLGLGWRTRGREGGYGLVLQGGGIAVVYLTVFAAAKIYGLVPLGLAFAVLSLVVCFGVALAVLQGAQILALLATAGGFLAPILTSSGSGSHVGLFSFYLLLDLGILAVALFQSWRLLNWVGFIFTFVISTAWGVLQYQPSQYLSTQPFLIAYFALFLIVSLLFSFKQPPQLKGFVDGSLVFGLPLVAFSLQIILLHESTYGLAISSVILAAIYLTLSAWLVKKHFDSHELLATAFLALGFTFITLAIPLALSAQWTAVTWAIEAGGLVWIGLRQSRLRPRVVGYLLHVGAASAFIFHGVHTGVWPIISGSYLSTIILTGTALWISYIHFKYVDDVKSQEALIGKLFLAVAVFWWHLSNLIEIKAHGIYFYRFTEILVYLAATLLAVQWFARKLSWSALAYTNFSLIPLMIILNIAVYIDHPSWHLLQGGILLGELLLLASLYQFLNQCEEDDQKTIFSLQGVSHLLLGWFILFLFVWEGQWQAAHWTLAEGANLMLWLGVFATPLVLLFRVVQSGRWPAMQYGEIYKHWIPAPLWIALVVLFVKCSIQSAFNESHFLPVINFIDLSQFAILLLFGFAVVYGYFGEQNKMQQVTVLGVGLFVFINVVVLRGMSFYLLLPYEVSALWDSPKIQMALSILWTLCALVVMNASRRLQLRNLWMLGAGLLAIVVLKLFTKDLSSSGTLANIISFMVVGVLMLLIGYLSPAPKSNGLTAGISTSDKTELPESTAIIQPQEQDK